MLNAGKDLAAVLLALEVSGSPLDGWRVQCRVMTGEEAKGLKQLEDVNRRLKQLVADQALHIEILNCLSEGKW